MSPTQKSARPSKCMTCQMGYECELHPHWLLTEQEVWESIIKRAQAILA